MDASDPEALYAGAGTQSGTPPPPPAASEQQQQQPIAPSSSSTPAAAAAAAAAAPPPQDEGFVKGLESEVNQVLGGWKSFWGGVSKQVAPTLAAVQKDLSTAATQAKAELTRLQAQAAEARAQAAAAEASGSASSSGGGEGFAGLAMMGDMGIGGMPPGLAVEGGSDKGKGRETQLEEDVRKGVEQASEALSGLFGRLQASLPRAQASEGAAEGESDRPSLPSLASFQQSLASTLSAHPNLNPATLNVADLRSSLTSTFQKLQTDLHLADAERLAEEYLKKSSDVLANAGQFLEDAIKIVPPPPGGENIDIAWDGSDAWALPSDPGTALNHAGGRLTFDKTDAQVSKLTGKSLASVRQTRHAATLHALRSNRSLMLVDPAGAEGVDADVRAAWAKWEAECEKDGGIDGEKWTEKVWAELGPTKDVGVEELKAMRDELVPSQMDKTTFWKRYFFRVHQVELDAERRSALLDTSTTTDEDDFSWEDDEDDKPPASSASAPAADARQTTPKSAVPTSPSKPAPGAQGAKQASAAASSRESSEEGSFDIVSNASAPGVPAAPAAAADVAPAAAKKDEAKAKEEESEEDSDWE